MIKNILAAIGAVTVGAIALGAVIGHCAVTTANDDDFDLEKDLRKARDYCRKKAEELDEEEEDDEEGEGEPQNIDMSILSKTITLPSGLALKYGNIKDSKTGYVPFIATVGEHKYKFLATNADTLQGMFVTAAN